MNKKMNAKQMAATIQQWHGTGEFGIPNSIAFARILAIFDPKFYKEVIGIIKSKGVNRQDRRRGKKK